MIELRQVQPVLLSRDFPFQDGLQQATNKALGDDELALPVHDEEVHIFLLSCEFTSLSSLKLQSE